MVNIFDVAEKTIKAISAKGAEGEVVLCKSDSVTLSQRLLKLEEVIHSSNCQVGVRVIVAGKKYACISSNDLSKVNELVDAAVVMASSAPEDPYITMNDTNERIVESSPTSFDSSNVEMSAIKERLMVMEEEALSHDKRIVNSEGASFSRSDTEVVLAGSNGFLGSYKRSNFSTYVSVVACENGEMEVDYSFSVKHNFADLEDPRKLGKESAARALQRLNPQKVATSNLPIVVENRVASSILSNFASAIRGNVIADKTSFLVDSMNCKVFSSEVCIVDDPLLEGGLSSRPFDGEGVRSRKNEVVKDGVINSWILDMRSASRLNLCTTGNAVRHGNASVSPGVSNFYMQNTDRSVKELMSDIKKGIYIVDLFGFGVNLTTGDYSQGAFGFLIENGTITHPVNGITVAGNLRQMFSSMSVADDLVFLRSVNCPTIRFENMVVAGVDKAQ